MMVSKPSPSSPSLSASATSKRALPTWPPAAAGPPGRLRRRANLAACGGGANLAACGGGANLAACGGGANLAACGGGDPAGGCLAAGQLEGQR